MVSGLKAIRNMLVLAAAPWLAACSQTAAPVTAAAAKNDSLITKVQKMKVEIWSDVMCPFCYIGKRKFEAALQQSGHQNDVEVVWKSFQLNPDMKTDPAKSTVQYLAEAKGWSMEQTRSTMSYVTNMAKEVGLVYDFDHAVVANSFDAHRLIQMAKKHGKGAEAEEGLFKAYFTDGKNTADHEVLVAIGKQIGLNEAELRTMLEGSELSAAVAGDLNEAQQLGINAVPFFVFDRKYAVSGAQDSKVFLDTLNKALAAYPAK